MSVLLDWQALNLEARKAIRGQMLPSFPFPSLEKM